MSGSGRSDKNCKISRGNFNQIEIAMKKKPADTEDKLYVFTFENNVKFLMFSVSGLVKM